MKERLGTGSTLGSSEITGVGGGGVSVTTADVHLDQQSKALSADNSLNSSSGQGDNGLDVGCGGGTAASSPATLPLRLQPQSFLHQQGISPLQVEVTSCCSSSQGASRASTLSLKKKKVNIVSTRLDESTTTTPADNDSDLDLEGVHETTALNYPSAYHGYSNETTESRTTTPADNYLTMSGTITRGKRSGQQADVKVNVSREELELIEVTHAKLKAEWEDSSRNTGGGESRRRSSKRGCCCCSLRSGVHIWIWSILSFPFVFLIASLYSFYMGTLTWYNVFSWYTEEKPFLCRVLMAPLLIMSYPILILVGTIGLGFYAACSQLTCHWFTWQSQVQDLEKGFYAWLCTVLRLEDCSPYTEVVIVGQLDSLASPPNVAH